MTLTTGSLEAVSYKGEIRAVYVLNVFEDKLHVLECRDMNQAQIDLLEENIESAQDPVKFYEGMKVDLKKFYRTFHVDKVEELPS